MHSHCNGIYRSFQHWHNKPQNCGASPRLVPLLISSTQPRGVRVISHIQFLCVCQVWNGRYSLAPAVAGTFSCRLCLLQGVRNVIALCNPPGFPIRSGIPICVAALSERAKCFDWKKKKKSSSVVQREPQVFTTGQNTSSISAAAILTLLIKKSNFPSQYIVDSLFHYL